VVAARPINRWRMRALVLIGCGLFMAFIALFYTDYAVVPHTYAAIGALGSLLLTLK
jgi:energy-converting hydrogenase Eha subunit C